MGAAAAPISPVKFTGEDVKAAVALNSWPRIQFFDIDALNKLTARLLSFR